MSKKYIKRVYIFSFKSISCVCGRLELHHLSKFAINHMKNSDQNVWLAALFWLKFSVYFVTCILEYGCALKGVII
jgi:hypothetical protein